MSSTTLRPWNLFLTSWRPWGTSFQTKYGVSTILKGFQTSTKQCYGLRGATWGPGRLRKSRSNYFVLRGKLHLETKKGNSRDLGDAPARAHGGGDARPRNAKELCVYFLKGKCTRGTRCRFGHLQPFNKGGDRRVFTTKTSSIRHHGNSGLRNKRPANRQPSTCFSCGQPGHLKKDCRKRNDDRANVAFDFALPAVEVSTSSPAPAQQEMTQDNVNMADGRQSDRISCWLIDGGASCHVVG